jgi:prepilin-type N-terminal cleavage/methylation domain-containing protein
MNSPTTGKASSRKGRRRKLPPTLAQLRRAIQRQDGMGLVEVLVAVAILSVTLVVLVAAISTGSVGVRTTEDRVTAENLARSQLEYTKSQTYVSVPTSYATVTPPAGYAVSVDAASIPSTDDSIQKITVTVTREGETLLTVEDFKVDR